MTFWVAIPVKPAAEGKSRLAPALPPDARTRLNARLFRHTFAAVAEACPPERIIVVSRDVALLAEAAAHGARTIAERGFDLNDALAETLPVAGEDGLLAISTDLPELSPADVRAMLGLAGAKRPAVAIAPDRQGIGTNALFTAPAGCIPFRFGEASFAAHLDAARRLGIEPAIVGRPGLAFDLDRPEDLRLLRG